MIRNLAGIWEFALDGGKKGIEQEFFRKASFEDTIELPTTTSEAMKGEKSSERFTGYLTDPYMFEGYAWFLKELEIAPEEAGNRLIFTMERTRKSTVWVDGNKAGEFDSFYVPHVYELTEWLTPGRHRITVMIDNTDYVTRGGHMTSPDTQTNWNGIVGEITLETVRDVVVDKMRIYPSRKEHKADIQLDISALRAENAKVTSEKGTSEKLRFHVSCALTRMQMKDGRNLEHFEPTGMQPAALRQKWEQKHVQEDLPYTIQTLKKLPDKEYDIPVIFSEAKANAGIQSVRIMYPLGEDASEWDEYNPNVYVLTVSILRGKEVLCEKTDYFGLRDFTHKGLTLYCNDEEIFLRGTHDGLIFPLTGYAPTDFASWMHIYGVGKEYGLNHYRYHTCCPPKQAFVAAAYLGLYIQAELAFWGSVYEPGEENFNQKEEEFLVEEGIRALDSFGNAPSFFALSMGNELWGSKKIINQMLGIFKEHDRRHLYTQGSNNHQFVPSVLENDDFFSGVRFSKYRLFRGSYAMCDAPLGFVQTEEPGAYWNYDEMICPKKVKQTADKNHKIQIQYGTGVREVETGEGEAEVIPGVPVISHEIGQYEFTPDFHETEEYIGVLKAENMKIFRERMEEKGLAEFADDYFKASGRLAAACYKLELEAAFRSRNLSGFQLLDLKDFSGQGTALVGILNVFLKNKGAVTREKWRNFCSDAVLLPVLKRLVFESGSVVDTEVLLRFYRPEGLKNVKVKAVWLRCDASDAYESYEVHDDYKMKSDDNDDNNETIFSASPVSGRGLFTLGTMHICVPKCEKNAQYVLKFEIEGTDIANEYEVFVYQAGSETDASDTSLCIAKELDEALEACKKGKPVLYFPQNQSEEMSLKGEYCTDFWCYPMFRSISESVGKPVPVGTMGLLINEKHPALALFSSKSYTTPQWYNIIANSRVTILDAATDKEPIRPIVRMMDNFERNHNLGLIYEFKVANGRMLVCTADLDILCKEHPEAAWLYRSLKEYAASGHFAPEAELSEQVVRKML